MPSGKRANVLQNGDCLSALYTLSSTNNHIIYIPLEAKNLASIKHFIDSMYGTITCAKLHTSL